jgi:hypothetical protein
VDQRDPGLSEATCREGDAEKVIEICHTEADSFLKMGIFDELQIGDGILKSAGFFS